MRGSRLWSLGSVLFDFSNDYIWFLWTKKLASYFNTKSGHRNYTDLPATPLPHSGKYIISEKYKATPPIPSPYNENMLKYNETFLKYGMICIRTNLKNIQKIYRKYIENI